MKFDIILKRGFIMSIKEIKVYDQKGEASYTQIFEEPDSCPICEHKITPEIIYALIKGDALTRNIEIVYRCPNKDCSHLFIAYFRRYGPRDRTFTYTGYELPLKLDYRKFPESISVMSAEFHKIYNQALLAEKNGLDQICGPGYRRALEFLIKDYLIHQHPEIAEEIKKMWLGKAIEKINDKNIKICAERAAWLGNDETHYVRICEYKDIENLKDLIDLVVMWIDSEYKTKKYEKEMVR